MNNSESQFIKEGIHVGAQANNAIADAITLASQEMLTKSLDSNFETILAAKMSQMVNETLALHNEKSNKLGAAFLSQFKTQLAQTMIDTQHTYNPVAIASYDISKLKEFDTDLKSEVQRLADESGTIAAIVVDETSSIGF
jgi:hypothetical protein